MGYVELADLPGMSGVVVNPNGTYTDSDTGNQLQYYGSSLWRDPVNGYLIDQAGHIQVAAYEVNAAGQPLYLALASADRVHADVATGNLPGAQRDLSSAQGYLAQISRSLTDSVRVASQAVSGAQNDVSNLQARQSQGQIAQQQFQSATNALQQANAAIAAGLPVVPRLYASDKGDLGPAASAINDRIDYALSQAGSLGGLFSDLKGAASTGWVQGAALYSLFTPVGPAVLIGSVVYSISLGQAQQQAVSQILDSLVQIVNDESVQHDAGQITDDEHAWLVARERSLQSYIAAKGSQQWAESAPFRRAVTTAGGYYNAVVPAPVKDVLDRLWGGSGGPTAGVESGEDAKAKNEAQQNVDKAAKCLAHPFDLNCLGLGMASQVATYAAVGGAVGGIGGLVASRSQVGAVIGLLSGGLLAGMLGYYTYAPPSAQTQQPSDQPAPDVQTA